MRTLPARFAATVVLALFQIDTDCRLSPPDFAYPSRRRNARQSDAC